MAVSKTVCLGNKLFDCIGIKPESAYFTSWSDLSNGKTQMCKDCSEKYYQKMLDEYKDDKLALLFTCAKLDMPFIQKVYKDTLDKKNKFGNPIPFSVASYVAELHRVSGKKEMYKDFSCSDIDIFGVDIKAMSTSEEKEKFKTLQKKWGTQIEEDYEFLEEVYERYTENVEFVNSQQEDLYRDLCRDRLLLRQISDGRYKGDESLDKVQSRIAKTMSILKLDTFESNRPKTLSEQALFEKIRLVDENNVSDLYSEPTKYYDLNKIQEYNEKFSLRPLLNMLVGHRDFSVNLDDVEKYNLE